MAMNRPHIFPLEAAVGRLQRALCGMAKDHNPQRMPHWPERYEKGPRVCPICVGNLMGPR